MSSNYIQATRKMIMLGVTGILVALMFIIAGIIAATTISKPVVASYPSAGTYSNLPGDVRADVPDGPEASRDNSLYLSISDGRFNTLQLGATSSPVSLGKVSGLTYALHITSDSTSSPLYIETLTIDGLECTDFAIENSEIYTLYIHDNTSSGLSVAPTSTTTVSDVTFGSLRGVSNPGVATGPSYDRFVTDGGAGGASVKLLKVHNVTTFAAPCLIEYVHAGYVEIKNSRFGNGPDYNDPNFRIASTTLLGAGAMTVQDNIEDVGVDIK
jgi:hypothetical protein